jgi:hypothetical protein
VLLAKYYLNDRVKEDEMGRVHTSHCIQCFNRKPLWPRLQEEEEEEEGEVDEEELQTNLEPPS